MSEGDFDWEQDKRSTMFIHPDLSRGATLFLGILTFWPIIYMGLFFVFIFGAIAVGASGVGGSPGVAFGTLVFFHVGTILLTFAMTAYYAVYVFRDARFTGDKQLIWLLVVLLGGFFGQAAFYSLWFVRHDQSLVATSHQHLAERPTTEPASIQR